MIIGGHSVVCAVLAVVGLLCMGVDSSIAAPSISSVSGTVSNGQAITITGSSFGAGPSVLVFDDFEGGTNGSQIATGSGSAKVGQWNSLQGSPAVPVYSNSQKVSGNLAAHMTSAGANFYNRLVAAIPKQNKVFMSWWMWVDAWPINDSSGNPNWKVIWLMNSGTTDYDLTIPTYLSAGGGLYGSNYLTSSCGGYAEWTVPAMSLGSWKRTWVLADATSDGKYIQSWELTGSGVQQDATSSNSASSCWFNGAESFSQVYINGYMGIVNTSNAYFDDIYIAYGDNAMARVEIGNASTYNACTNLTIATPTSWGASSITATVRQGSFGSSGSAYLYVVDASGASNANGYPITFGGGSTGPAIPTGLHLQE
jgi:hypothetical protein